MNNLHYLCNDLCTVDGSAERRRSHQGQEVVQRHVGCQGHLWPHERHLVRHPWGKPCLKCTHFITCMQKWKIRGNTLESEQAIVSVYLVQAPDCVCFLFPCFPDVRSYLKSWPRFSRSGSSPTVQDGMLFSSEMWVQSDDHGVVVRLWLVLEVWSWWLYSRQVKSCFFFSSGRIHFYGSLFNW